MSSRRKSRPVRRLDTDGIGELKPLQLDSASDAVFEDQTYQASLPTPEDSPQDLNLLNAKGRLSSNSDEDRQIPSRNGSPNTTMENRNPPEGVFIVQPQSVSDDEGQDVNSESRGASKELECHGEEKTDFAAKKRQLDEFKEDLKKEGLDLSFKRRRMENGADQQEEFDSNEENANTIRPPEYQANLQRFENFIQLLAAKRRPIADESRDSIPKDYRSQSGFPIPSTVAGNYQSRDEVDAPTNTTTQDRYPSASSNWDRPSERETEEKWENKDNFSMVKSLAQGAPYSSSLTPAVAAAMMATLVSNSDANVTEPTASSAVLQNLFKQRESLITQQTPPKKPSNNQYSTSPDAIDTITAGTVSSGVGSIKKGTLDPTSFDEEVFDKYISRFSARNSCMQSSCPHINRDHFHCTDSDCNFQRFTNKSDVIRHYNMHKKRDNSLAHGFMRFSPTDNCTTQFGACHLNGKSTHYHCLHSNCTRVYTSTSDVMTHENFHKKNQHFVTNGFQRYRATEVCDAEFCPFRNQRTTHFHCTRKDCNFTFKNKCDMDKHKSYHMRDDAYTRQGFKKFYKNEACQFPSCAWNRTANHFHCLRKNCDFSFTSTGQMVSHKRKHDRQDMLTMEKGTTNPPSLSCSSSDAGKGAPPSFSGFSRCMVSSTPLIRATYTPQHYPPLYLDSRSSKSNVFRAFPFLSPYLSSSFLKRPSASLGIEPGRPGSTIFDSMRFHEAARKVLAAIPSTAATVPRSLPNFNQTDSAGLPNFNINATSFNTMLRKSESPMQQREEVAMDVSGEREECPPPPYADGPLNMSNCASSAYEQNEGRHSNSGEESEQYAALSQRRSVVTSPEPQNEDEDQVLNLSRKPVKEENLEKVQMLPVMKESTLPSPLVLKYFRGVSPNECRVAHCVFVEQYHFHCVVQDCFAAFTDKSLVFNHTLFHDNLERLGVSQVTAKVFPSFFPPISRSVSSHDPSTPPPPGYIALSSTSSRAKEMYREKENGSRDVSYSPPRDQFPKESKEPRKIPNDVKVEPVESNKSQLLNPTPQDARSAIYEYYLSRFMNKNNSIANFLQVQQSCPPSTSAKTPYMALDAPSDISSFARSKSCTLPETQEQNESFKSTNNLPTDGYIHVRAGSACIRPDCKYLLQSHWHCTLNRCRYVCKSLAKAQSHRQAHDSLEAYARAAKEYFKSYTVKKNCPNPTCEFRLRGHYHCLKPGCQFVTIGTSKLPWHMKKHEKIAKREASGFKYYTKKDQCGKPDCKYNGMFSHYHCVRAGCAFAFQYKHQMSTHVRKHLRRMLGRSYSGADVPNDVGNVDHSNVDSGDDSLPLIVDEADEIEQRPGASIETTQPMQISTPVMQSGTGFTQQQLSMLEQMARGFKPLMALPMGQLDKNNNIQSNAIDDERVPNNLSNEDVDDNSSNEEILDLRASVQDIDSNSCSSSNNNGLNDDTFAPSDAGKQQENEQLVEQESSAAASFLASKRRDDPSSLFSKFRLNNDVMSGFKRYLITEDCGDPQCSYSLRVSHYHCLHEDCHYRFTGRTHMFKHRQHHERVAGLIRDDFKRFKATQNCHNSECTFNGTNTHFHCLRCDFKCTDSAKVGAHRRHHLKADTLEQSGFERFKGKEDCGRDDCKYRNRNTSHFHCLQPGCSYSVVGLTGIEQHSKKHERFQAYQPSDQVNFSIIAKPLGNSAESSLSTSLLAASLQTTPNFTYSVPFTALSSAPSVAARTSDTTSPTLDEQPSVSPTLTSHTAQISNKPEMGFINLANMAINREIPGNPVSAGFKM